MMKWKPWVTLGMALVLLLSLSVLPVARLGGQPSAVKDTKPKGPADLWIDGEKFVTDTEYLVTSENIGVRVEVGQQLSKDPDKVWIKCYPTDTPTIPELPPDDFGVAEYESAKISVDKSTIQKFWFKSDIPAKSNATFVYNTIVVWARYADQSGQIDRVLYARASYKFKAVTAPKLGNLRFNNQPVGENGAITLKTQAEASLIFNAGKVGGGWPTRVLYKHLPGTHSGPFHIEKQAPVSEAEAVKRASVTVPAQQWLIRLDKDQSAGATTSIAWAVYSNGGRDTYQAESWRYFINRAN